MPSAPTGQPLPESYRTLGSRFGIRVEQGAMVYDQGVVTGSFYVVADGRIVFEIVDAGGVASVVQEALPGELFGHVSAFSGRPTSASATAAEPSVLFSIPVAEATDAFRAAPELAVALVRQFAAAQPRSRSAPPTRDPDDVAAEPMPGEDARPASVQAGEAPAAKRPRMRGLSERFNERWFFRDDITCPVCGVHFEYLRVRASAVRPVSQDSDYRIVYRTVDPLWYSVIACPECAYAAYLDDFETLSDAERRDLLATRSERDRRGRADVCGERTASQAAAAMDMALACYETRRVDDRRRAGLLHRRAWLERARGNEDGERTFLTEAVSAYVSAYELNARISDEAAARAAYLIGDLSIRLGEVQRGVMWLTKLIQMPEAQGQRRLLRTARDRLTDAREQYRAMSRSA